MANLPFLANDESLILRKLLSPWFLRYIGIVGHTPSFDLPLTDPPVALTGSPMKQLLLVLAVSVSLLGVVSAGSDSYSGKEMKQVTQPVPPPCPKWSGFYIGIQGGYTRALFDPNLTLEGGWVGFAGQGPTQIAGRSDFNIDGGQLGGVFGYNFTFSNLLVGIEGSGVYNWARDSRVAHFDDSNGGLYRLSTSADTHYLMTIGPRIGWTFCKFMPFVTGGAAFADLIYNQSITFVGGGPGNTEGGGTDEGHVGWFVGGGLEYAITDHWHIRGDYKYVDFGERDGFTADFGANSGGAPMHSNVDLREHAVTAAITYQF